MKSNNLKAVLILLVVSLFFTSCEDSSSEEIIATNLIIEDETIALVESDDIADEIDNVVDDVLAEDFGFVSKEVASKNDSDNKYGRPECLIKTIVLDGDTKTVTLDFGDGCELPNGHVLSGQIVMSYVFDLDAKSIVITKTFQNFFFNDVALEGESTILKTWKNSLGNTQSVNTTDVMLTWPDGETASRVGTRTREWVEGKDTKTWGDNVFSITGNTTTTFKDGAVYISEIVEPLRREMSCRFIVNGTIEISKEDKQGVLDYGDGSCDNIATFTNLDGEVIEITLRKRKK